MSGLIGELQMDMQPTKGYIITLLVLLLGKWTIAIPREHDARCLTMMPY